MYGMRNIEDVETFMLKHGESIVDTLGSEVDRIEQNLKVRFLTLVPTVTPLIKLMLPCSQYNSEGKNNPVDDRDEQYDFVLKSCFYCSNAIYSKQPCFEQTWEGFVTEFSFSRIT